MGTKKIEKVPMPAGKRIFDVIMSSFLLLLFSPVFVIILLSILIEHLLKGKIFSPLFYKEIRISQGEPFNFIKFNVFKPDVISKMRKSDLFIHTKVLERDKKNLTWTGRILQKIYLDELPQLVNVLKGSMSMVGPRPVNPKRFKIILYEQGYTTKAEIKAGLTGSYQAHKGEPGMIQNELDQAYIQFCRNNPAWKIIIKDIKIIFRTFIILIRAKGI